MKKLKEIESHNGIYLRKKSPNLPNQKDSDDYKDR